MPALGPSESEVQPAATPAIDHSPSTAEATGQTSGSVKQPPMDLLDPFGRLSITSNCSPSDHEAGARREAQEEFAREAIIPSPAASPPPKTPPPIESDSHESPMIVGIDCVVETLDDYYSSGAPVDEEMMPELGDELMEDLGGYGN